MKYMAKPILVDAWQFDGKTTAIIAGITVSALHETPVWLGHLLRTNELVIHGDHLHVFPNDEDIVVEKGDWIIFTGETPDDMEITEKFAVIPETIFHAQFQPVKPEEAKVI